LGISFSATSLEAAQLAGSIFKRYRREGAPREHLISDFLIGAHAQVQADRLAAMDRGYLRRYFPRLRVVKP
jgi:predicted nucleic acid-binding protein